MTITDVFQNLDLYLPQLIAGLALAAACSILSVLVVLKRLAFIGQGISHAGFGGVGLAAFLALNVSGAERADLQGFFYDLIVFLFCVSTGVGIGLLSRRRNIKIDTAIGILLVAAMALGFLLEQARWQLEQNDVGWYQWLTGGRALTSANWHAVLFGSISGVVENDMWMAIIVSAIVLALLALLFKEIIFYSFDERVSQVFGVPSGTIHYLILVMMAVLIVFTMKLVGLILVNAFLVVPGATATLLSRKLRTVLVISFIVGELSVIGGNLIAFTTLDGRLPPGPLIVLVMAAQFAIAWLLHGRLQRVRS